MGRVKKSRIVRTIRLWVVPITIAATTILGVHLVLADPEPTAKELLAYLENNQLNVGTAIVDGYQQVYYAYNGNRIFMEKSESNLSDPMVSGRFVTWVESQDKGGQIFLHDVVAKTTLQLTNDSTNLNPYISDGRVVWERWVNGAWQVYYYDGISVSQLSSGNGVAIRPDINGNQVVYAEYTGTDWQVIAVDLGSSQVDIIQQGDETTAWPRIQRDGSITTSLPESL